MRNDTHFWIFLAIRTKMNNHFQIKAIFFPCFIEFHSISQYELWEINMKNYVIHLQGYKRWRTTSPVNSFFGIFLLLRGETWYFHSKYIFFSIVVLFATVSPVLHQVFNRSFVWSILDIRQPKYICMYMLKQVLILRCWEPMF